MMAWIPTHFLLRTVFFFVGVLRVVFRWAALLTFLRAFFTAFLAVLFASWQCSLPWCGPYSPPP